MSEQEVKPLPSDIVRDVEKMRAWFSKNCAGWDSVADVEGELDGDSAPAEPSDGDAVEMLNAAIQDIRDEQGVSTLELRNAIAAIEAEREFFRLKGLRMLDAHESALTAEQRSHEATKGQLTLANEQLSERTRELQGERRAHAHTKECAKDDEVWRGLNARNATKLTEERDALAADLVALRAELEEAERKVASRDEAYESLCDELGSILGCGEGEGLDDAAKRLRAQSSDGLREAVERAARYFENNASKIQATGPMAYKGCAFRLRAILENHPASEPAERGESYERVLTEREMERAEELESQLAAEVKRHEDEKEDLLDIGRAHLREKNALQSRIDKAVAQLNPWAQWCESVLSGDYASEKQKTAIIAELKNIRDVLTTLTTATTEPAESES